MQLTQSGLADLAGMPQSSTSAALNNGDLICGKECRPNYRNGRITSVYMADADVFELLGERLERDNPEGVAAQEDIESVRDVVTVFMRQATEQDELLRQRLDALETAQTDEIVDELRQRLDTLETGVMDKIEGEVDWLYSEIEPLLKEDIEDDGTEDYEHPGLLQYIWLGLRQAFDD